MRRNQKLIKNMLFLVLFFGLLFGLTSVSRAEEKEEGMYFSILGVQNYIEGDFDGESAGKFENSSTICTFPEIDSGKGFGILIGGYRDKIAGEIYYSCSKHETSFTYAVDIDDDGFYDGLYDYIKDGEVQLIGVNIKYHFVNLFSENISFYIQSGIFYPIITLEQAAYNENNSNDKADVTYTGYGLDAGIGALIHLHPKLAISAQAVYRYLRIEQAEAFGEEREPTKSTYGNGRSYTIGLIYYF